MNNITFSTAGEGHEQIQIDENTAETHFNPIDFSKPFQSSKTFRNETTF